MLTNRVGSEMEEMSSEITEETPLPHGITMINPESSAALGVTVLVISTRLTAMHSMDE
jgi:hypothetical protein